MAEFEIRHRRLIFSWAHIIAFIAMIAATYFAFAGAVYLTGGNFTAGYITGGVTFVLLFVFFIIPQQLKGTSSHFARSLMWEKVLVAGAVPVFLLTMVAVCHFWTVESRSAEISTDFAEAIKESRQMFADYEAYSEARLKAYENGLDDISGDTAVSASALSHAGFNASPDTDIQRANMIKTLRLRLLSDNYTSIKKNALSWIASASEGVSAWNVFLLGNTMRIKEAVNSWEQSLTEMTSKEMSNETTVLPGHRSPRTFENYSSGASLSRSKLNAVEEGFTAFSMPSFIAIGVMVLLAAMLALPYLIQRRDNKNGYSGVLPYGVARARAGGDAFDRIRSQTRPEDPSPAASFSPDPEKIYSRKPEAKSVKDGDNTSDQDNPFRNF